MRKQVEQYGDITVVWGNPREGNLVSIEKQVRQFDRARLLINASTRVWNDRGWYWKDRHEVWLLLYRLAIRCMEEDYGLPDPARNQGGRRDNPTGR